MKLFIEKSVEYYVVKQSSCYFGIFENQFIFKKKKKNVIHQKSNNKL